MGVIDAHGHHPLDRGWQLCAVPAGAPWPGDEAGWLDVGVACTAAAGLRQAGTWSLHGPARSFDADDWCWRLRFDRPSADGKADVTPGVPTRWVLGFDGLATVSEVWLNGTPLLAGGSMFVAHQVDVGAGLQARGNELRLRCHALAPRLAQRRPRPRWRTPMVEHGQLRWFRTTLLGRTPGWSPPAAPVGPWRDVWLQARPLLDVHDLQVRSRLIGDAGELQVEASLLLDAGQAMRSARLVCHRDGHAFEEQVTVGDTGRLQGRLRIDAVQPWWPHSHGEPALYGARLELELQGRAAPVCVDLGAVGFRRVELDRRDNGFALRVNGVPVFCRGACWTPIDPVSLRATPAALRAALRQVRAAGMNMLRLAGPTVYEEDAFYAACDAEGVMVWQDFMFANMDYPAEDAEFTAQVDAEVTQQLQRLQPHACLTVLCGNSEQEQQAAMWAVDRGLWEPALFHQRIAGHCARLAPHLPYWPSSAHGGAFPFQPDAGTTSYYGVGAYLRPVEDARTSSVRFASECLAFANYPSSDALARAPAEEGEHPYQSRFLAAERDFHAVRDHYFAQLTGVPAAAMQAENPARFLALSRWLTGYLMGQTFAQWRSQGSVCGGGLVWFLRDMRPGAGWGLLDDHGLPKAAWHLLGRMLQPLMVALVDQGLNGIDIQLVNDGAEPVDALLEVDAWQAGRHRVAQVCRPVTLPPRSAQRLPLAAELDCFVDLGHAYRFGPPPADVLLARLRRGRGGPVLAEAVFLPSGLTQPRLADIGLTALLTRDDAGTWALEVGCTACAIGVHIEVVGHAPDDDFFCLGPGEQRRIGLRPLPGSETRGPLRAVIAALNTEQCCTAFSP